MQDPAFDVCARFAVTRQKAIHQLSDLPADQFRHILRKQDVESGIAQVEPHGIE